MNCTFNLCGGSSEVLESLLATLVRETGLEKQVETGSRKRRGSRKWVETGSKKRSFLFRPAKIAERVFIGHPSISESNPWKLQVELYPADTVTQARRFYRAVADAVAKEAFLSLEEWKVEPNLHFSFAQTHLIWAKTGLETREYLDRFSDGEPYGKMSRGSLLSLAAQWEREGLIMAEDLGEIRNQFKKTEMKTLNVVPGFFVSREWDSDTVIALEERGELEECIIDALATPLATWRETL